MVPSMRALQQSGCAAVRGKVCLAQKVALTHGVDETPLHYPSAEEHWLQLVV